MAFLTNFDKRQMPLYRKAVATWPKGHEFKVSKYDHKRCLQSGMGSLHYFGGADDLTPFWNHFDAVKTEMQKMSNAYDKPTAEDTEGGCSRSA